MSRAISFARAGIRPHLRKHGTLLAGASLLALVAMVAAALVPVGGSASTSVRAVAAPVRNTDSLRGRVTHVFGSNVPASLYGRQVAALEDNGTNLQGQFISDLPPLSSSDFTGPENSYRRYAESWSRVTASRVGILETGLASGNRARAQQDWASAWGAYMHLGAVYGFIGNLNQEINGMPGEIGDTSHSFTGFHRIEMGLWNGASLGSLEPWAQLLARDVARLPRAIATADISSLNYSLRSHEILEDAQRDLMSGLDVPWSGEGVLGTAAGIAATREVIRTLSSLLQGRDSAYVASENQLALLSAAFDQVRAEHGGAWPTLSRLTLSQRELLDGRLAGALTGGLQQLPGALETVPIKPFPRLP